MGTSPIVTRGFIFTIALVTTAGYGSATPPVGGLKGFLLLLGVGQ